MTVTIQQIKDTGTEVAVQAGYAVNMVGTRLHSDGSTNFLWYLAKGGKKYTMQNAVTLKNVDAKDLHVFAHLMQSDLLTAVEYT